MADPVPQPEFNAEALKEDITKSVMAGINTIRAEEQARTQAQDAARARQQQAINNQQAYANDPIASALQPYLGPFAQVTQLQIAAANDKADFYLDHPEAVEFRGEIEPIFNNMMAQGRAMDRKSVYEWYQGHHADKFFERRQNGYANTVRQNATAGAPGVGRPHVQEMGTEDFMRLPVEERRKRLENVTF